MVKAVIFDMDGTLIDSFDLHAKAWQDAFLNFGHVFELKAIRDQIGKGGDQLLPVFLTREEIDAKGPDLEKRAVTSWPQFSELELRYRYRRRVIVVRDAGCSSSDEGHGMLRRPYHSRYTEQIETADAATILAVRMTSDRASTHR
jgi:phosphoglycolate phosphatase-like HAD superfamily hydrolase